MLHLFLAAILALGGSGMTDDILGRLERLERDNASLRGQVGALSVDTVRTNRSRRDAMSSADMNALLAPRSLGNPIGARAGRDSTPDLGSPLLSRLRDDSLLPGLAGGRIESVYPNQLLDPLFDTFAYQGALSTVYVAQGLAWQAKYVLNSGTVATTRSIVGQGARTDPDAYAYGFETSRVLETSLVFGVNASDMTVYLEPVDAFQPAPEFLPSWLTASVRVVGNIVTGLATATAKVEIVDGTTEAVLAESDSVDLITVADLTETAMLEAGLEGPTDATTYRWRLAIDVTKSAGAVAELALPFADPLLAYSDDGSSPTFTPAVGRWAQDQLVPMEFVQLNIPAGTTANMPMSENGAPAQIPVPWAGHIVGMSYRMDGTLSAGTLNIRAKINGTNVWTAHSLDSASGADGTARQGPGNDMFVTDDIIAVDLVSSGGFLPTTRDIVVVLWLLIHYTE